MAAMRTTLAGLAGAGAWLMAGPAVAGLEICNQTDLKQSVAIGHMVDGEWTSEGWWNLDPGACAEPVGGDLANRYYYYRAEAAGAEFEDEGVFFCTIDSEFTIAGQDDCAERGYGRVGFRKIDTGPTATSYTVTLEAAAAAPKPQVADEIKRPVKRTEMGPEIWKTGLVKGEYGEPFYQMAQFQGCDAFDGARYCAFHAAGWKWFNYYGGPVPDAFLDLLATLPVGMYTEIEGDILSYGDISVEMALTQVTLRPNGFPFQQEYDALQGEWISLDDPLYRIEFAGSEVYETHDGAGEETFYFWRFADSCEDAPPDSGMVLIKTEPETQDSFCYLPDVITDTRLEMFFAGRGNLLRFRRP
ncbi:MAG: DUF1036 domain-containing protein [Roseovarius sp.]